MDLLEREPFLGSLEGFLAGAREGRGCLVLGGEAGIGKTSLIRAFCDRHRRGPVRQAQPPDRRAVQLLASRPGHPFNRS
jgi:predicted ATPase